MLACHELDAARAFALCGGDDYELCVAVPKQLENEIADVAQQSETTFTKIGELIDGNSSVNPVVLESNGRNYSFDGVGYEHF
jgi:thiamine-monophosphate kinase